MSRYESGAAGGAPAAAAAEEEVLCVELELACCFFRLVMPALLLLLTVTMRSIFPFRPVHVYELFVRGEEVPERTCTLMGEAQTIHSFLVPHSTHLSQYTQLHQ